MYLILLYRCLVLLFYGILRLFYSLFAEKLFQRTCAEYMLLTFSVGYFAYAQYDVKSPIGTSCLAITVKIKKENGGRFPFFFLLSLYIIRFCRCCCYLKTYPNRSSWDGVDGE